MYYWVLNKPELLLSEILFLISPLNLGSSHFLLIPKYLQWNTTCKTCLWLINKHAHNIFINMGKPSISFKVVLFISPTYFCSQFFSNLAHYFVMWNPPMVSIFAQFSSFILFTMWNPFKIIKFMLHIFLEC